MVVREILSILIQICSNNQFVASEPPKICDLQNSVFLRNFVYFIFSLDPNCSKQSAAPFIKLKKINVCSQNHKKKNQNKNFVKKINHEYFGGSDVMNVSKMLKSGSNKQRIQNLKVCTYTNFEF